MQVNKLLTMAMLLTSILMAGCVTPIVEKFFYDSNPVTFQVLGLFNQRTSSNFSDKDWKGDWIFRRERLSLIDQELRNLKVDVVMFQEMMERYGGTSDSDRSILSAGALEHYDWHYRKVKSHDDSGEAELMGLAVGLPYKISWFSTLGAKDFWEFGGDGYMLATELEVEKKPLLVFNVQMPSDKTGGKLWYKFVAGAIKKRISSSEVCSERVVVGGYLPGAGDIGFLNELTEEFDLIDTSSGFCEIESNCYTETPKNELFVATKGEVKAEQSDRILAHRSVVVERSSANFSTIQLVSQHSEKYGVQHLWPSTRLGWNASLRFASCSSEQGN